MENTIIFIVFAIIITFFIGFIIGLSMPFILKKYFNINESNINYINRVTESYNSKFNNIDSFIQKISNEISCYKTIPNDLEDLKNTVQSLSKNQFRSEDMMQEWFTGIESGGDISGTS